MATILLKRGLTNQAADAVLKFGEPLLVFNAERNKVELWAGTSTNPEGGTEKILVNPDVTVPANVSDLNNDSDYQTGAQVTAAISAAMASALKPGGSKASVAELPALSEANVGFVYNVTAAFTTTADFVEGAGVEYGAGTNVAIVNAGTNENPVYKYDVYGNFVDLSGLVEKEAGKGLSTNDYTTAEKTKLENINSSTGDTQTATAAEKAAWNAKLDSSSTIDGGTL